MTEIRSKQSIPTHSHTHTDGHTDTHRDTETQTHTNTHGHTDTYTHTHTQDASHLQCHRCIPVVGVSLLKPRPSITTPHRMPEAEVELGVTKATWDVRALV